MINKTVIPAAGFGTRMMPAAKAVPKEMLPVLDRPTIQYVVEEAAGAGIRDALLVVSEGKRALTDHFGEMRELEERLRAGGKESLLASVNDLMKRVRVRSVLQREQLGLGHAVMQAREMVGGEAFLCQLGDAVFSGEVGPAEELVRAYEKFGAAVMGVEEVPREKGGRYGVVGGEIIGKGVIRINMLVEKPA